MPHAPRSATRAGASSPRVQLVGAGPGDPELLTLKAARAIASADVILVDDLVDRAVLAHARPEARVIEVGKRGGCKSTSQAFINRLMVRDAHAGRRVVRLKGGDPFVFGRGGEEQDALRAAGIDVEVIPGITAGIAAPGAIGVPVTDRRYARGVAFVTGHTKQEGDEPDWNALAKSGLTLVIYMGVVRCASITARLLDAGLAAGTPAAVIQHASTPLQRSHVTTLEALAADIERLQLGSPAILVIGDVVRAATALSESESPESPAAAEMIAACGAA
jgi:uroporphyrin-III C-methyltransferase